MRKLVLDILDDVPCTLGRTNGCERHSRTILPEASPESSCFLIANSRLSSAITLIVCKMERIAKRGCGDLPGVKIDGTLDAWPGRLGITLCGVPNNSLRLSDDYGIKEYMLVQISPFCRVFPMLLNLPPGQGVAIHSYQRCGVPRPA